MAFIEGICKNCGGTIRFDDSLSSGICEYCKTKFVKEDIIVHNHFHDSTVIFNEGTYIEEKLESAEAYLTKLYDYEKARKLFDFVTENNAGDYRGWWGIVRVLTKQFTFIDCTEAEYEKIKIYYQKATSVAQKDQKKHIESIWTPYSQKVEQYIENNHRKNMKKNRNKRIRLSISIILSLVCNIFIAIIPFTTSIVKDTSGWGDVANLLIFLLGGNVIITTVLGLIGSTKLCSTFPAISAAIFLSVFLFKSYQTASLENADVIIKILGLIILCLGALAIVAVCYMIPAFILNKFVTNKNHQ